MNIHENPTAGSVVAKLRRRSQLNRDAVKRISTPTLSDHKRISGSSLSDHSCSSDSLDEAGTDQEIDFTEQFLFEVGGNIGECFICVCVCNYECLSFASTCIDLLIDNGFNLAVLISYNYVRNH